MLKLLLCTVFLSLASSEDVQKIKGDWKLVAIFSDNPITDKDFKRDCNAMSLVNTNLTCECGDLKDVAIVSATQNGILLDSRAAIAVDTKEQLEKYWRTPCHCGDLGIQTPGVMLTLNENYVLMFNWPAPTAQILIAKEAPSLQELEDFKKSEEILKIKNSFAGCVKEYEMDLE